MFSDIHILRCISEYSSDFFGVGAVGVTSIRSSSDLSVLRPHKKIWRPGLAHCKQSMNTSKLTHSIVFLVKCRVVFVFSHCSRVSSLIEQIFVGTSSVLYICIQSRWPISWSKNGWPLFHQCMPRYTDLIYRSQYAFVRDAGWSYIYAHMRELRKEMEL